jgi:hypothetical protein
MIASKVYRLHIRIHAGHILRKSLRSKILSYLLQDCFFLLTKECQFHNLKRPLEELMLSELLDHLIYHLFLLLDVNIFKKSYIYLFYQFALISMHFTESSIFLLLSLLLFVYQVLQDFEKHNLTISKPELIRNEHSFLLDVVLEAEKDALFEEHAGEFLLAGQLAPSYYGLTLQVGLSVGQPITMHYLGLDCISSHLIEGRSIRTCQDRAPEEIEAMLNSDFVLPEVEGFDKQLSPVVAQGIVLFDQVLLLLESFMPYLESMH